MFDQVVGKLLGFYQVGQFYLERIVGFVDLENCRCNQLLQVFDPAVLEGAECVQGQVAGPGPSVLWRPGGIALVWLVHNFVLVCGLSNNLARSEEFLPLFFFAVRPFSDGTATLLGSVP